MYFEWSLKIVMCVLDGLNRNKTRLFGIGTIVSSFRDLISYIMPLKFSLLCNLFE